MDYRGKVRRSKILISTVIVAVLFGCSMVIGPLNVFKSILFLLPFFTLLPIGGYYIIMRFDGRTQYLLFGLWLGFVFAISSLVGILIDPRLYPLDWLYIFKVVGVVWLVSSFFVFLWAPVLIAIFRWFRKIDPCFLRKSFY